MNVLCVRAKQDQHTIMSVRKTVGKIVDKTAPLTIEVIRYISELRKRTNNQSAKKRYRSRPALGGGEARGTLLTALVSQGQHRS